MWGQIFSEYVSLTSNVRPYSVCWIKSSGNESKNSVLRSSPGNKKKKKKEILMHAKTWKPLVRRRGDKTRRWQISHRKESGWLTLSFACLFLEERVSNRLYSLQKIKEDERSFTLQLENCRISVGNLANSSSAVSATPALVYCSSTWLLFLIFLVPSLFLWAISVSNFHLFVKFNNFLPP